MGFGLFAGSLGDGAHHGDQVLLLLILVVVPLQQGLTDLHSHTVVQLVGCLLVVKHHVCSARTKNVRVSEVRLFCEDEIQHIYFEGVDLTNAASEYALDIEPFQNSKNKYWIIGVYSIQVFVISSVGL